MNTQIQSKFMQDIIDRGYFYQATHLEQLDKLFLNEIVTAYIGFDPTATSLHVGNLMQIMLLRKLQQAGHRPIIIIGGGTVKLGDPTGKDEMRKLITDETIENNTIGIKKNLQKFIRFDDSETGAIILNNNDWIRDIKYMDFLRDHGMHFSINRMLTMDSVKSRLENERNLTFLEFNYMLLQAYDFLHLRRHHGCKLQIGGSDQWGNIVMGVDLIHKMGLDSGYGMTTNLITTASGAKMGKTVSGAVWVNEDMCSAYDYWQFWRNSDDRDVVKFLKLYTDLTIDEIEQHAQTLEINELKKLLATATTSLCHGESAALAAQRTAQDLFENNELSQNLPTFKFSLEVVSKKKLYEVIVEAGLAVSNSEARTGIRGGAVKINDEKIQDEFYQFKQDDFVNNYAKLMFGKKKCVRIEIG